MMGQKLSMHAAEFLQDALEIRTYLHDRSLMEYADSLEASGKGLPELLNTSPSVLSLHYGMKRGHVARFIDRTSACGIVMPPSLKLPARKRTMSTARSVDGGSEYGSYAPSMGAAISPPPSTVGSVSPYRNESPLPNGGRSVTNMPSSVSRMDTFDSRSDNGDPNFNTSQPKERRSAAPIFKGIVAAVPPEPRLCGFVGPPSIAEDVAPLSVLDKISVQKITPEYRPGVDIWGQGELRLPPPMKASDIWISKPTIVFCIRRPGCVMCRAEAHQLYSRKPIFDALGVQLVAVLNELIDSEVKTFWPRFWGGMIVVDKNRDFFKALGGGVLPTEGFITGFIFNPIARANYARAKATGIDSNLLTGEGTIKGGLLIVRPGKGGVAYQFVERNFGDWAPLEEVLEICGKLQLEGK